MEGTVKVPPISMAAARVNAGLNQQEAAQKLGISKATLANYEAGRSVPDWEMVHKIGDVYQYPHEYIFFGRKYV